MRNLFAASTALSDNSIASKLCQKANSLFDKGTASRTKTMAGPRHDPTPIVDCTARGLVHIVHCSRCFDQSWTKVEPYFIRGQALPALCLQIVFGCSSIYFPSCHHLTPIRHLGYGNKLLAQLVVDTACKRGDMVYKRGGHASEACWYKQGRASNSNNSDSDDSGSYKSGSNGSSSGSSYKSGSNGSSNGSSSGSGSQQSGSSHQSNKHNQAQNVSIWGRPLKCVVASADGVIQTPYNPPLRVAQRKGDDFWAVDADGDVLMCTVCSGRNLPGEWCLQDCMARIGRQQHADSARIQTADESGLQRAMEENFCPKRELAGTLGKHTLGSYVVGKRVS